MWPDWKISRRPKNNIVFPGFRICFSYLDKTNIMNTNQITQRPRETAFFRMLSKSYQLQGWKQIPYYLQGRGAVGDLSHRWVGMEHVSGWEHRAVEPRQVILCLWGGTTGEHLAQFTQEIPMCLRPIDVALSLGDSSRWVPFSESGRYFNFAGPALLTHIFCMKSFQDFL